MSGLVVVTIIIRFCFLCFFQIVFLWCFSFFQSLVKSCLVFFSPVVAMCREHSKTNSLVCRLSWAKKSFFSCNITDIRPIRTILFLKCSARYALSIRQIGTEIGQVFVAFQTKEEKTTKVSIVMRRQLLRNEYTSDSSADSTNRQRVTCELI